MMRTCIDCNWLRVVADVNTWSLLSKSPRFVPNRSGDTEGASDTDPLLLCCWFPACAPPEVWLTIPQIPKPRIVTIRPSDTKILMLLVFPGFPGVFAIL